MKGYWVNFYFRPFIHAGPYCIGMLAGYLLATRPKLKIPLVCNQFKFSKSIERIILSVTELFFI